MRMYGRQTKAARAATERLHANTLALFATVLLCLLPTLASLCAIQSITAVAVATTTE